MRYFHDEQEVRRFHEDNLDLNLFDQEMGQELLPLAAPAAGAKNNGVRRRATRSNFMNRPPCKLIAELARKAKVDHYATSDQPF